RPMRLQWFPAIEVPAFPAAAERTPPVDGVTGVVGLAPPPSLSVPEFLATIAVIVDEGRELLLRDGGTGDVKRRDRNRVRPLLVIEHERLALQCPEREGASRNRHIARQGALGFVARRSLVDGDRESRRGIAQGLPGVGERLIVHIFVEQG